MHRARIPLISRSWSPPSKTRRNPGVPLDGDKCEPDEQQSFTAWVLLLRITTVLQADGRPSTQRESSLRPAVLLQHQKHQQRCFTYAIPTRAHLLQINYTQAESSTHRVSEHAGHVLGRRTRQSVTVMYCRCAN